MPANQAPYIWTFKSSRTQSSKYAIELWATAVYDFGESLALFMGFLEYDWTRPGHTRIPTHNN